MAQQNIDFGSFPNDPSADSIQTAFQKANTNFSQLFAASDSSAVTSINRTPGAGITVNQSTGNVVVSATIACVTVRTSSLSMGINSNGGTSASMVASSSQDIVIDIDPNNVRSNSFAASGGGLANLTGTLTTAAASQPNVTSVGTLVNLSVTGNAQTGNVITTGIYYPNGSPFTISTTPAGSNTYVQYNNNGALGADSGFTYNVSTHTLNATNITGNGVGISNIAGANVSGTVANATYAVSAGSATTAGTVTTNAQPNITSTGTLTTLSVTGNSNIGNIGTTGVYATTLSASANANVGNLGTAQVLASANITAPQLISNISTGTAPFVVTSTTPVANLVVTSANTVITGAQPNITSTGTLASLSVSANANIGNIGTDGIITATGNITTSANITGTHYGAATGLTSIPGANVTGTVANATYATSAGSAGSATYATTAGSAATATTAGTVTTNAQPNITSTGTLSTVTVSGVTSLGAVGNVKITGGTNGYVLATDGAGNLAWTAQTGGGGSGSPGGSDTQVQFNDAGLFGGNAGFTFNKTTGALVAPYFSGDGSNLTNVTAGVANRIVNGSSNVIVSSGANVDFSIGGTANVMRVFDTGANVAGTFSASGNVSANNVVISNVAYVGNGATGLSLTAPTIIAKAIGSTYVQAAVVNGSNVGSADLVAYGDNGTDASGWADIGFTGSDFSDANYTITGKNDGYFFVQAVSGTGLGGNAVIATGSLGTTNDIIFGTGGFGAANEKMRFIHGTGQFYIQPTTAASSTSTGALRVAGGVGVAGNIYAGAFYGAATGLTSIPAGNITGAVAYASVANSVAGANITGAVSYASTANSVAGANVSGEVAHAAVANSVAGANVSGIVAEATNASTATSATTAGTVSIGNQPNITSTGTLISLSVSGNANVGNIGTTNLIATGAGSFGANVNMNSHAIINVTDPVSAQDAATKAYVDSVAQGLDTKASVYLATTSTLPTYTYNNGTSGVGATLTGSATGALSIDSISVSVNDRILVKNELSSNQPYNGIYIVTTAGNGSASYVLTRSTDFDTGSEIPSAYTFVEAGTLNADTGWTCTTNSPITVGTTNIVWAQFSGAGSYSAGTGLTLTGTTFSVNASQTGITTVGTLSSLSVSGTATVGNIAGNGVSLYSLTGANVTGTVPTANNASYLGGTAAANYLLANGTGSALTSITGSNVSGTVPTANNALYLGGTVASSYLLASGTGSALTSITGANVTGTVPTANNASYLGGTAAASYLLASGTGSSLTAITGGNVTGTVANATYAISAGSATTAGSTTTVTTGGSVTTANITTGSSGTAGTITGNWTLGSGSKLQATYADLAEYYAGSEQIEPGTVVEFGGNQEVQICDTPMSTLVAGIVTTDPAYIMNAGIDCEYPIAIALQGRIPAKVIGPVKRGDMMVSTNNGHAIACSSPVMGSVLGKALTNFDGATGIIEIMVGRT